MRDYDLTKMDLEGITYSSALLRHVSQVLGRMEATLVSDCFDDADKIKMLTANVNNLRTWLLTTLTVNSEAIDFQLNNMHEEMLRTSSEIKEFLERYE